MHLYCILIQTSESSSPEFYTLSALNFTTGFFKKCTFLTNLTSAALDLTNPSLLTSSSFSLPPTIFFHLSISLSLAIFVFVSTSCILAKTFSVALASGNSVASTSSSLIHASLSSRPSTLHTASLNLTSMSAANISPVPLKKQSIAGILMLKILGSAVDVIVEPTTERWGSAPGEGSEMDVTIIWGILYTSCNVVIANLSVSISWILTPDNVLQ